MNGIQIRKMEKEEAELVWKIGRQSFGIVEGLAFQKPQNAFLAIVDNKIAGMASYKLFPAKNNQKIGYVETCFVKKEYAGKGVGTQLYQKATQFLKEQGCETAAATVKDDNVASWKLFENNGYHITGYMQMLEHYGFTGTIRLWFQSTLAIATGFDIWTTIPVKRSSVSMQIVLFALLNLLILLPSLLFGGGITDLGVKAAAVTVLLASSLAGGLLYVLLSREKWHFRVTRGGLLISVLVTGLGGYWPMAGRFYPEKYQRTSKFSRSMGLEGLFEWLAILLLVGAGAAWQDQSVFWQEVCALGTTLLLLHSLPMYPFACFGGNRIWEYSKILSVGTMIISGVGILI